MKSNERRIIILKNLNSPNFDQAFFLLKDGIEENSSAVYEAERIIEEYMFPSSISPPRKKVRSMKRRDLDFLPFAITAAIAVLAGAAAIAVNIM